MNNEIQIRTINAPVSYRAEGEGKKVSGYAALYNSETKLWYRTYEVIAPGAFKNAVSSSEIVLLLNHDANHVLGRTKAGTLSVWEDDKGLPFEGNLPSNRADVAESVERGDLYQCSFAFTIKRYEIEERGDDEILYRILEVDKIYDVSIVTYPAYPETSVSLNSKRTIEAAIEEWRKNKTKPVNRRNENLLRLAQASII